MNPSQTLGFLPCVAEFDNAPKPLITWARRFAPK
jgi:hypothetical protein